MEYFDLLTDSAQRALDNLTNDFRCKILQEAYLIAKGNSSDEEISLNDIIEAKNKVLISNANIKKEIITSQYKHHDQIMLLERGKRFYERRRSIIFIFLITGLLYTFGGILYYLITNLKIDLTHDTGLLIAVTGAFLSILSFILIKYLDHQQKTKIFRTNSDVENQDFIIAKLWSEIESQGNDLLYKVTDKKVGEDGLDISNLIDFLSTLLQDRYNEQDLKQILRTRNAVVHGEADRLSSDFKERVIEMACDIIQLLNDWNNSNLSSEDFSSLKIKKLNEELEKGSL